MSATQTISRPKVRQTRLLIDGEFREARGGKTFATINPATEEKIADVAEGQALDIQHGAALMADQSIRAGKSEDFKTADCIVITAGLRRKPDESRLDLINRNVALFRTILADMKSAGLRKDALVFVVSNPVDVLTYLAIKELGLLGKIKVYEKGGSPWAIEMLRKGEIAGSQPQYPYTIGRIAVEQIADAFAGKTVPRFVPDYGVQYNDTDKARGFQFLDQKAAEQFKSEY